VHRQHGGPVAAEPRRRGDDQRRASGEPAHRPPPRPARGPPQPERVEPGQDDGEDGEGEVDAPGGEQSEHRRGLGERVAQDGRGRARQARRLHRRDGARHRHRQPEDDAEQGELDEQPPRSRSVGPHHHGTDGDHRRHEDQHTVGRHPARSRPHQHERLHQSRRDHDHRAPRADPPHPVSRTAPDGRGAQGGKPQRRGDDVHRGRGESEVVADPVDGVSGHHRAEQGHDRHHRGSRRRARRPCLTCPHRDERSEHRRRDPAERRGADQEADDEVAALRSTTGGVRDQEYRGRERARRPRGAEPRGPSQDVGVGTRGPEIEDQGVHERAETGGCGEIGRAPQQRREDPDPDPGVGQPEDGVGRRPEREGRDEDREPGETTGKSQPPHGSRRSG